MMRDLLETKRLERLGMGCLAVLLVAFGCMLYAWMRFTNDPFNDRSFEQQVWLQNRSNTDQDNPRGQMAHDLATLLEEQRPTRAEVVALLGEPDAPSTPDRLSYHIGMWTGFRIDNDTLDIVFDGAGRVADASVVQH